jgi:hypothetical protein
LVKLIPTAQIYFQQGHELCVDGALEDAVTALSKALELEPENGKFLNERGMAYFDGGDLDRAIQDFSAAIALKKNGAEALVNRANTYRQQDDTEKALGHVSQICGNSYLPYATLNKVSIGGRQVPLIDMVHFSSRKSHKEAFYDPAMNIMRDLKARGMLQ